MTRNLLIAMSTQSCLIARFSRLIVSFVQSNESDIKTNINNVLCFGLRQIKTKWIFDKANDLQSVTQLNLRTNYFLNLFFIGLAFRTRIYTFAAVDPVTSQ